MDYHFDNLSEDDREAVIDIFNYYIENGFSAYPEHKVPYNFFDLFLSATQNYPAITIKSDASGEVIGFAFLRPYNPMPVFKKTAEISYFIKNKYTGKGIGKSILEYLIKEADKSSIDSLLASISSFNKESINFHLKNGFVECGRFLKVGTKFDRDFDVVWMQKIL